MDAHRQRTNRRRVGPGRTMLAALSATALLLAAACGDDTTGETDAPPAPAADDSLAALLPPEVAEAGTLTVATDASYAPNEFFDEDGSTIIGMDIDLITAMAGLLGLEAEISNAGFDGIIPGLDAGRFDVGISSFTDTSEREEIVDFVTYFEAGTSFFTRAEGGVEITGLADLCGLTVAVQRGTVQEEDASAQSEECVTAGSEAVQVDVFPDQNGANLALTSGRADLSMADSPVAGYQVELSEGALVEVGEAYGTAPY
nr:ABC transporter substrate-binding protein [Micromonospora sp. DSM 115978]